MRKRLTALLLAALLVFGLAGCSPRVQKDRITVVAAIFPEYDWVRQIIGADSEVDLRLLVDDGVDPHSFQPTVDDIVLVSQCDLLIYGGGESDEWLENVPSEKQRLALLPLLGERAMDAEIVEGMQVREAEDETDEHVWLSLRNAKLFCQEIAAFLSRLDPKNADKYAANLDAYTEKLDALDARYQEAVKKSRLDTILVCDRFPFRYLVEDYGLHYYAAFPGCSAESGASFKTIVFLTNKVRELNLNTVLTLENSDTRLAKTVAENSGWEDISILPLDSMQSVSLKDAGIRSYLDTMEQNLAVLEKALN